MKASDLIKELRDQITLNGDMEINVMIAGEYCSEIFVASNRKDKDPDNNFMTIFAKPLQSNECFYLDENGKRCDAAFFTDDDNFEWSLDYQITESARMRENGFSDEIIKNTYPLGLAALNEGLEK